MLLCISYSWERDVARTIGIWIFGLLGSGIAGGMIGIAIIQPVGTNQFLTFVGGFASGLFAFACARLWLTKPQSSN
jgi:zinc transporter ZupT